MCGCFKSKEDDATEQADGGDEEESEADSGAGVGELVNVKDMKKKKKKPKPKPLPPLRLEEVVDALHQIGIVDSLQAELFLQWWTALGLATYPMHAFQLTLEGDGSAVEVSVVVSSDFVLDVLPALAQLVPNGTERKGPAVDAALAGEFFPGENSKSPVKEATMQEVKTTVRVADDTGVVKPKAKAKVKARAKKLVDSSLPESGEGSPTSARKRDPVPGDEGLDEAKSPLIVAGRVETLRRASTELRSDQAVVYLRLGGLSFGDGIRECHADLGVRLVKLETHTVELSMADLLRPPDAQSSKDSVERTLTQASVSGELGWTLSSVGSSLTMMGPHTLIAATAELSESVLSDELFEALLPAALRVPVQTLAERSGLPLVVHAAQRHSGVHTSLRVNIPPTAHQSIIMDLVRDNRTVDVVQIERIKQLLFDARAQVSLAGVEFQPDGSASTVLNVSARP
jgi:hypothetical protein